MKKSMFLCAGMIAFLSLLAGWVSSAEKPEPPMIEKPELPIITEAQSPIGNVSVLYDRSARDALFEQLKKFADKHAFAIRIARIHPKYEEFTVSIWRTDLKLLGGTAGNTLAPGYPVYPMEFELGFYENSPHPVPTKQIDFLVNDLKRYIGKVKGVAVQTPKK